jgi:hypothetical protein
MIFYLGKSINKNPIYYVIATNLITNIIALSQVSKNKFTYLGCLILSPDSPTLVRPKTANTNAYLVCE